MLVTAPVAIGERDLQWITVGDLPSVKEIGGIQGESLLFAVEGVYEHLPEWITEHEEVFERDALTLSFLIGRQQMYLLNQFENRREDACPVWLLMRVGGPQGMIYKTGRFQKYNTMEYVQMLGTRAEAIRRGPQLEVHNISPDEHDSARFLKISHHPFDVLSLRAQLAGVQSSFSRLIRADGRMVGLAARALEKINSVYEEQNIRWGSV